MKKMIVTVEVKQLKLAFKAYAESQLIPHNQLRSEWLKFWRRIYKHSVIGKV